MMSKNIEDAFKKCFEFIDNSTPEELLEYEKGLRLNPEDYKDSITLEEYSKRLNRLPVIKAKDSKQFIKEFNEHLPTKEMIESCRKAGKMFGKAK